MFISRQFSLSNVNFKFGHHLSIKCSQLDTLSYEMFTSMQYQMLTYTWYQILDSMQKQMLITVLNVDITIKNIDIFIVSNVEINIDCCI